jgi:hypothetical protein
MSSSILLKIYYDRTIDLIKKGLRREKVKAEALALFCYWAVRELGYSMLEIAGLLGMSQPGVVYAVRRGEHIAQERGIKLTH